MAKKLAGGSSKNKKDSSGKRLGFKCFPGERVKGGSVILRQRGTKWYSGENTTMGRDHTINSTVEGKVTTRKRMGRKFLEVSFV